MLSTFRTFVASVVSLAAVSAGFGQPTDTDSPNFAGHWSGAILLPSGKLAIDIDFLQRDSEWSGDISIPVQMVKDMPLGQIAIEGSSGRWMIPGIPGEPTFHGKLSEDGGKIAGTFTQGGGTLTFEVERKASPAVAAAGALDGLDALIDEARSAWKVPGVAVGVVKSGEVVFAKGFGLRDVDGKKPVTPRTLFAIGSTTKAFTTFVMGTLVDEGKLDLDKRVRDYVPTFKLYDDVATELITPRDLVTHRSGLPRHDLLWYNSTITLEDMVERLAYLENSKSFRGQFQYNNLMFGAAGYLIERITGGSWEQAVQRRVFGPLGMAHSNFSVVDSQKSTDHALPYEERDGAVKRMAFRDITNVGPAGSINSCVEDMTGWIRVHLAGGRLGERQLIGETTLRDIHSLHMAIQDIPTEPDIVVHGYGLGWMVGTYRGHHHVEHGGAIDGFTAEVSLLPNDDAGIIVLANLNGTPLPGLIARHVMDRLLGLEPRDWSGEALAKHAAGKSARDEAKKSKNLVRRVGTKPSHALREYAGDYEHPGYGQLRINAKGEGLEMIYNRIAVPLDHWHFDVFAGTTVEGDNTFEEMRIAFRSNFDGDVDTLEAPLELLIKPIVFTRRPDAELSDPNYLAKFVGDYELAPQVVKIGLKGCTLVADIVGQPTYELVPTRDNTFSLKDLTGFSAKFIVDDGGLVTEIRVNQPNGVFTFKRK